MALYRAMETRRPPGRRLFTDPYAIHFLDRGFRLACRVAIFPVVERLLYRIIQRRIPGALASGLARTRYIDDLLEKGLQAGGRQVIVLGAGFDTRSLRLQQLRNIPVIEIDHPDTAARKLSRLRGALPSLPANTRYLPIDFNRQSLEELSAEQGIDRLISTIFIWEGVTNYLQQEAIDQTFTWMGTFPPGSSVLFTYIDKKVLDEPDAFFGAERLLHDLDAIEERWTWGIAPEALPVYLRRSGYVLEEDAGAADYRQRYLPERKNLLKGYEFYRVAMAMRR